jgi:hypothetical protein
VTCERLNEFRAAARLPSAIGRLSAVGPAANNVHASIRVTAPARRQCAAVAAM